MNYHNISKNDMLNGEGLRVVLWVSGCSHNCPNCHNPQTHDPLSGIAFDDDAINEIFAELDKDYISGITFSGGDPLNEANEETILKLAKQIKKKYKQKTIWLYTGYVFEQIKDHEIIKYLDILCDGRFVEKNKDISTKWVGSTNQRIIDIKKTIKNGAIVLYDNK